MIYSIDDINNHIPDEKINITEYQEYFAKLYHGKEITKLAKLLGILTLPILNAMFNKSFDDEISKKITIKKDNLLPVAISFIQAEGNSRREYGDADATETLNYFIDEDTNKSTTQYYDMINL